MLEIDRMKFLFLTLLIVAVGALSPRAEAQPAVNANAVYNGWIQAYTISPASGQLYFANDLSDRSEAYLWGQAYLITEAEDAYFQNRSAARYTQLVDLLNRFIVTNGTDWSGDTWDDDLEWCVIAMIRGYEITGNTTYLNAATQNWNTVYNRGWDSVDGGGIWENMTKYSKCVLSNAPYIIGGIEIYRATGDSSYLSNIEPVYTWMRNNLFNSSNSTTSVGARGQASECLTNTGSLQYSDNIYNTGLVLNAANSLYRVTSNSEYYGDVQLAASHVMNEWPIMNADYPQNGSFSSDHFVRGLAAFSTQNNLWSTYQTYLQNNANAAWSERRTDYNISWNKWTSPTTTGNVSAMETGGSVTIQASLPPSFNLAGTYEIQNVNSGLVLNVKGASKTAGAEVIQYPYQSGAANELWTFVPTAGGYYQIQSVNSGLVLNVSGTSTQSGALIVQWTPQGMSPGNDQWLPAQNNDGTFSFYNLNSQQALELPGGTRTSGAQLDQSFANNSAQQKFNLIQPNLNLSGTFEIQNTNSGLAVNVSGSSTSDDGVIDQYAFSSGNRAEEWTFVPAQPGYYRVQNVNSGLDINVTGASAANGALLIQYSAVGSAPYNDQWRPVLNSNGSYSFYNSNSSQALEVPGASTASKVQLDQWPENGTAAQTFKLILQ